MKAANAQPEIVTRNGKPVSVILPIKKYQEIIERHPVPGFPSMIRVFALTHSRRNVFDANGVTRALRFG
jgi:hypothetical protein